MASKLVLKLEKFLLFYGVQIEVDTLRRTYAGYWQKKRGMWLWRCWGKRIDGTGYRFDVGSQDSLSYLMKKNVIVELSWDGGSLFLDSNGKIALSKGDK